MSTTKIPPSERMLNLVIALASSGRRMTRDEIRERVVGYDAAGNDAAFGRMFERDKDELRAMGVPLVTETDILFDDEVGYRIDTANYAPEAVNFTSEEVALLTLAVKVWQDATLASPAARGLTKLKAIGDEPERDAVISMVPTGTGTDEAFSTLLTAVEQRRHVEFSYRTADGGPIKVRKLQPWRLLAEQGVWYVIGQDLDREAPRSFRLSRIVGTVRATGPRGAYEIPEAPVREAHSDGWSAAAVDVTLLVREGKGNRLRDRAESAPAGRQLSLDEGLPFDQLSLRVDSLEYSAADIATFGDDVVVVSPIELQELVIARLRSALELAQGTRRG